MMMMKTHTYLYIYKQRDSNWDGRAPPPIIVANDDDNNDKKTLVVDAQEEKKRMKQIRKEGVTRHILLIRHGQYEETHKVCGKYKDRYIYIYIHEC